jgi:tetratricopeptide (TPR) repeat protein
MKRECKITRLFVLVLFALAVITLMPFAIAQFGTPVSTFGDYRVYGASVNPQFNDPNFFSSSTYTNPGIYWSEYNSEECLQRQDFVMQILPGGCSPAVVRSDLLEEQNVPVFCKVMATQINPLIDVSRIRSLRFSGDYPKGISGVSYFPARAALRSGKTLDNSPIKDNLGYLVIVLSKQTVEAEMPDYVEGNITATIDYDMEGAFGISNTNFYLSEMSEEEWRRDYKENGFWNGKGYIRADSIESDRATISVYNDIDTRAATVTIRKGETSRDVFLGGFYCAAGLNFRLEDITAPVERALLQINDQQVWVAKGDRILDEKCRITDLQTYSGGGKVSVSCPIENGRFDLTLNPGKAFFDYGDKEFMEKGIGTKIDPGQNIYLAYVGLDDKNEKYAVLIRDDFSFTEREFADKQIYDAIAEEIGERVLSISELKNVVDNAVRNQYRAKIRDVRDVSIISQRVEVGLLKEGETILGITLDEVDVARDKDWTLRELTEQERLAKKHYDLATDYYQDLFELYPGERHPYLAEDPYAARGLFEAAQLSREFGMNEKAQDFYDTLLRKYPNSDSALTASRNRDFLTRYDTRESKAIVIANNQQFYIDLLDFRKPTSSEANAVFLIDGKEETIGLNEIKIIGDGKSIQLTRITNDFAYLKYHRSGANAVSVDRTERLGIGEGKNQVILDDSLLKLIDINLEEQVKLRLVAKNRGTRTESDFKFRIGIEKRAIKLTPEQTRDVMNNLIETIKMWEDINNKLGKLVTTMKAACFATSAILTAKNLFEGLSGKSLARQTIMTSGGGWNEKCENLVNDGAYRSIDECLLDKSDEIKTDVDTYAEEIQRTNEVLKGIQKDVGVEKTGVLDFKGQVDSLEVEKRYKEHFMEECKKLSGVVTLPGKSGTTVPFSGDGGVCDWDSMTHEQRKEILSLARIRNSGSDTMREFADRKLGQTVLNAKNFEESEGARIKSEEDARKYRLDIRTTNPFGDKVTLGDIKTITNADKGHQLYGKLNADDSVIRIFIPFRKDFGGGEPFVAHDGVAGKEVIVQVTSADEGDYYVPGEKIFLVDGTALGEEASASVKEYMSLAGLDRVREANAKEYENPMLNPDRLTVKYFERAPYKGLPAEVPFDIRNGWYVELTYVLTGFGKPYDESGRAVNYYICNVGMNGIIEFKKSGDDICRYYNGHNDDLGFPGLSAEESRRLVNLAQRAITDAANQYGKERVVINGQSFKSGTAFGGEEGRCSDFMSPKDCQILFNVCDPVICPSSRCDLGGRYRVDNVVQSGIIGSLTLCLPNFKEGIFIPVCLTGIHAGIEGYVSILNSTVQCMNESLETGRNVGVCDEIKSIYVCEFFWKQFSPLVEILIPTLLESFYSQGARGGGEYLTVQSAWDNTQGAINFFKNDYAVNSFRAFNARSTEEIGTDICKAFVSVNLPASKGIFDTLIEPDSPVQYHAWFSENQLTTATIPPTSHYKVYYHIFAGKDQGAYYAVYLRDLPVSSQIRSSQTYVVDRGYVTRGSQVDEARDFTAVSGYRQLCVNINGRDECGFGKVSTSYALNSLSDRYAEEQLQTGITSEKECIAGTPSLYSLAQPNIQAGVEEVLQPELYNEGIIRVCASESPGKEVTLTGKYDTTKSGYDRWKAVGYCDDPTIKCWLDTNSVKDVIKDKGIEENVLKETDVSHLGVDEYFAEETSRAIADDSEIKINELVITREDNELSINNKILVLEEDLKDLTRLAATNIHRARGFYLLGRLHKKIAESLLPADGGKENKISYGAEEVDIFGNVMEVKEEEEVAVGESETGSKVIFEFQDGKLTVTNVFYRYAKKWEWSLDRQEWVDVNQLKTADGTEPAARNIVFIRSLQGVSYQEGVRLLAVRTIRNDEGGVIGMQFGNTNLVVHIGELSEEYGPDHLLLRDTNILLQRINDIARGSTEEKVK